MAAGATTRMKHAVVLGMGVTGAAFGRYLHARGYRLTFTDTRAQPPQQDALRQAFPDAEFQSGGRDMQQLLQADLVAVSPGVAADDPDLVQARAAGIDVAGDIELLARATRKPVAAITGTNGKSTVTSLLGMILIDAGQDVAVGGNLGTPALDLLAAKPKDGFVLELSSFQLDLTASLKPACAAILNLSADHLDRYRDLTAYAASKQRIYRGARSAICNADDPLTHPPQSFDKPVTRISVGRPTAGWGLAPGADGSEWLIAAGRPLLPVAEVPLAGRHNLFNVLAALAMAAQLGVEPEQAVDSVRRFEPLPHRCTPVGRVQGVWFVDDSKATNVGACMAAIEGLQQSEPNLVVILGGVGKGADFDALRPALARSVKTAVLLGEAAPRLERALKGSCALLRADDMNAAVAAAFAAAAAGDTVLLAPACASFDMFSSYVERGQKFSQAVQRLGEGAA